ncbi:MAG TPA: tRNA epoxyqueuosine(34) reductase QueG [Terriglobales bacterium]|nr:tRNA epoxyqueuosine(34) reductase QueG [Terriglobales bacterium]
MGQLNQISQIAALVKQTAHQAGFELAGIAPVRDLPELDHFPDWIEAGYAGEMKYMEARDKAGQLKRASLRSAAPWARSVIVCAINYNTANPYSTQVGDSERGWISRYAWSREDYHEAVMRRLRVVEDQLRNEVGERGQNETVSQLNCDRKSGLDLQKQPRSGARMQPTAGAVGNKHETAEPQRGERLIATQSRDAMATATEPPALQTHCYVDTGPLVERVYAKYAGVGWIGKNTCILNQKMGSWLFLGVILTSLELEPDLPAPDRCGSCTRCIDACPTDALIAPYQLDSNKCISYLTIEKRGAIPEDMREGMGRHVFGCDICQDVCPWNRKAPATSAAEFQSREGLVNPALDWLAEMSAEEFLEKFRGSPIRRTKRTGLRRNAAIAVGNSGDPRFLPVLKKLVADEDSIVAQSAKWAVEKLSRPAASSSESYAEKS